MCGRFAYWSVDNIRSRFETINLLRVQPSYNIAPGSFSTVITRNSPNKAVLMKWGLIPFWATDPAIGFKMINARSEGIEIKPAFRKPIRSQRCLVPADGFYEWKRLTLEKKEEKIPWFIGLKNGATFSLAGIYDEWQDSQKRKIQSFAIITTVPNILLSAIHNRMPVILDKKDEDFWLNSETPIAQILTLLKPFPENQMTGYPVSNLVNNPENNDPSLILV